ncbi:SGNH/GDSL hydrolase family protein [Blastococcus tunisiensis]|uniref:Lysophospholipase L1 n=1 Tax=Blastococcus tunisiensis TaxID=1798228 RepID=A0A1I2K3H5_9ACTN|nr:SGNH/GDSL hydrolase family protein [Blastococcus sp. DSM 46838]SFF61642.1 Lysophospholipase L1 [Blastococcus sp. DSM 46838]
MDRPPLWGILALLLLVAGNVAIFASMAVRTAPDDAYTSRAALSTPASEGTASQAAMSETAAIEQPAALPSLLIYGDGYAAGNELGGRGTTGWPALIAERTGAELELAAVPRAGYASIGTTGENYLDLVQRRPATQATVTVLFGSRNDSDEDLALVQSNATQAVSLIRRDAPDTALVVVGPAWSGTDFPASLLAVRDAVRSAAEAGGAAFVDPLADGWFADRPELIAADAVSPTDEGHAYLAELLVPVVREALSQAAPATGPEG